jgi:hypothetical protein
MARFLRVSAPTLKTHLRAFESLFLLRSLAVEGSGGEVYFFEDQLELNSLAKEKKSEMFQFTHFVIHHVRAQFTYQLGLTARYFQYRTRGRAYIPLAVRTQDGCLGILPSETVDPSRSQMASMSSFLKTYGNSRVLLIHPQRATRMINDRILSVPIFGVI